MCDGATVRTHVAGRLLTPLHAGYSPSVELLGVSTVAGNQSVEKTTQNAASLLHAVGLGHIGVLFTRSVPLLDVKLHLDAIS